MVFYWDWSFCVIRLHCSDVPSQEKQVAIDEAVDRLIAMKKALMILGMTVGFAAAQVDVSVAGIQVVGKGYRSESEKEKMQADLRAFNWHSGTRIALLVTSKDKAIVNVDKDGSKVTALADEEGTDFTKAKGRFGRGGAKFGFPNFSDDQKAMMVDVESAGIPAKGSKELNLKGELAIAVASKSEMKKSKVVELKKGAKVVVGDHTFEVEKTGKPDWGEDPLSISFKSSVSHKDFKEVVFHDAEGNVIESSRSSSGSMGMFGKRTYTVTFNLKKKVDKIILGLDEWSDLEVIKVPLDLKIGTGL